MIIVQRLNRMKQIIREMSQWCDEFIGEEEQEENHNNPITEESVSNFTFFK